MASVVSICNLALASLGKEGISDVNEASAQARACRQFYDYTLDGLLQRFSWRFAGKTEAMAVIDNLLSARWEFAYQKPADCLKIRRVQSELLLDHIPGEDGGIAGGDPYWVQGDTIYCGASPAYLHYTARVTDPTKYPPLFVTALAWELAMNLAMPMTRDPKVRADAYQLARATFNEAAAVDANEVRETADKAYGLQDARA